MSSVDLFDRGIEVVAQDVVTEREFQLLQSGLPFRGAVPLSTRELANSGQQRQLAMKRVVDVVLSGGALLALLPMLLIVALAIKLTSPGPVMFRQHREGLDGTHFEILKFRSMRQDMCDVSGVAQTATDDPRITLIGRFIRRTSIDELPQLINVLRGDMSLVGPRPHVENMRAGGVRYTELVPYYHLRLQMRPGLTGWAQANGYRGSTKDPVRAKRRIDHDIAYIQNFSIWLDMRIIALTLIREFVGGSGE
jgi:lipopolysaccharide/colanic/teichoic acid biosynthesis glycosyltransferase